MDSLPYQTDRLYISDSDLLPENGLSLLEQKILLFFDEENVFQSNPIEKMYDYFDEKRRKAREKGNENPLKISPNKLRKYSERKASNNSVNSSESNKIKTSPFEFLNLENQNKSAEEPDDKGSLRKFEVIKEI